MSAKVLHSQSATNKSDKIVHLDSNQRYLKIEVIEEMYKCKYVGEFSVKGKSGSWANVPVSVFYQPEIPDKYKDVASHYMGIYFDMDGRPMITNAKSAAEATWTGAQDKEKNIVLYSAFRHDYQTYEGLMADGGQDYFRTDGPFSVRFKMNKDKLEITEEVDGRL